MAYFHATGVIATDLVRRETKRGVLASFRLVTATPGTGKLWITAEAWGHTAGILNTHGTAGRGVANFRGAATARRIRGASAD